MGGLFNWPEHSRGNSSGATTTSRISNNLLEICRECHISKKWRSEQTPNWPHEVEGLPPAGQNFQKKTCIFQKICRNSMFWSTIGRKSTYIVENRSKRLVTIRMIILMVILMVRMIILMVRMIILLGIRMMRMIIRLGPRSSYWGVGHPTRYHPHGPHGTRP